MAIEVEKVHQQKEKEKEQYKAVLAQKESELAEAKEKFQRELDQKEAEHREHFKNMESKINEAASNQETHNQKGQRDLELKAQELQAKNAALEHKLLRKQQSQEEVRIAQERFFSQAIDVKGDEEIEQLINASSEAANLLEPPLQGDWNAIPRELQRPKAPTNRR